MSPSYYYGEGDRIYRLLASLALCILLTACGGSRGPVEVDDRSVSGTKRSTVTKQSSDWVTVRRGDTLFSISFSHGYDFKTIARINGIKKPYTIYPGQRLRLKSTAKSVRKKSSSKKATKSSKKTSKKSSRPVKKVTRQYSTIRWQWPVKGRILRGYSSKAPRKKGIGITARRDQEIHAAAPGKVVYSGDGLIGYGNLIILKHDETYLSAYAHNSKVFIKEGQQVKKGQKVALMGVNENNTPMLHFEIRKNGKPVNPLGYLPK